MKGGWRLMASGNMIRCRNGHIVGCVEDGRLVMRYRKRTAVYSSERGDAEIICDQCGAMVKTHLIGGAVYLEEWNEN